MKKRNIIIICIITFFIISLYLYFAIKYSDTYTNLFSAISCIISCIATVSLGIIAVWQTSQYKAIEDNRHYLPNLLLFCFDASNKKEKLIFKANLTKKIRKIKVLLSIPNGTIYKLYLKSTKIYNNEKLLNSIKNENRTISFIAGTYENIIKQQETICAAINIDEQYINNSNFHFDLEFDYFNTEGKEVAKILRMKYKDNKYIFETVKKPYFV